MTNKEWQKISDTAVEKHFGSDKALEGRRKMLYGDDYKKVIAKIEIENFNLATFGVKNRNNVKSFIDAGEMRFVSLEKQ